MDRFSTQLLNQIVYLVLGVYLIVYKDPLVERSRVCNYLGNIPTDIADLRKGDRDVPICTELSLQEGTVRALGDSGWWTRDRNVIPPACVKICVREANLLNVADNVFFL